MVLVPSDLSLRDGVESSQAGPKFIGHPKNFATLILLPYLKTSLKFGPKYECVPAFGFIVQSLIPIRTQSKIAQILEQIQDPG